MVWSEYVYMCNLYIATNKKKVMTADREKMTGHPILCLYGF